MVPQPGVKNVVVYASAHRRDYPSTPLRILMEETEAKQTPPIRVAPIVEHKMRIAF